MKFGLIGKTLKHSYSKTIHNLFASYDYDLFEIQPEELKSFVLGKTVKGYNVTIPYKKDVIEHLDYIDPQAEAIGAVNTVVEKDGKLCGYNTDFDGMKYMFSRAGITLTDKVVMILGSGGTSNTANAVAKSLGAKEILTVSRLGEINYGNCKERKDVQVIINTTPVGMYPNVYSSPLDLDGFDNLIGVADVVYNPHLTAFLYQAKRKGIKYTSGLSMLVAQAKYAMEIFTGQTVSDTVIEEVISKLEKDMMNVILIGMPGVGKSSIGGMLSERLGRDFIDSDKEIEKRLGISIPEIFSQFGEDYFRKIETEVLMDICKESGKIIATGGGIVKREENYFAVKNNGKVFLIERPLKDLATDGRPLSKDLLAVEKLYLERKDLYNKFADEKIKNDGELLTVVQRMMEKL